jgi:hypothetical protein
MKAKTTKNPKWHEAWYNAMKMQILILSHPAIVHES